VTAIHYCESVNDIIEGYYAPDFDLSSFDDLEVPSEWQIKGYDTRKTGRASRLCVDGIYVYILPKFFFCIFCHNDPPGK